MEHVLVHPPFADPTQPYLALPTLAGALRAAGLSVRVLDLNVAAACWLLDGRQARRLAQIGRASGRERV